MEEHPLNESAWRRGWKDTKAGWKSWPFVILDAVVCAVVGSVFEWYWGLGLFLFALFCVWVGATARAPIKQRNEARVLLTARPKPTPLHNRNELRGAIASVENATIQLVNQQHALDIATAQSGYTVNTNIVASRDKAYAVWNDAMNELRRQYLIAGDRYEGVCIDLSGFIWSQIAIRMGQVKLPEGEKPIVIHDVLRFVGVLAGRVKEALRKIEEISGQALDKEGSQTE